VQRTIATLLLALGPLLACNTQAKWTYPVDPQALYRTPLKPTELVIGVLPFREERPVTNRAATSLLYMIPLMPYGWVTYERPEAARMFNTIAEYQFSVDEDLGKAAARSLEQSGLFRRVYFTLGGETREADYLFQGTARRTLYEGRIFSYGLSVVGPLLSLIGLPLGESINTIDLEYQLVDPDGRVAWSHTTSGEDSTIQGFFYNYGNDALNFATLMEKSMNEALEDLAPHVGQLAPRAKPGP